MLPLRLTARGCITAAREGCSKFAFTTPNLRPGTDGIGPVPAVFAVGAAMLPVDRDFAPPTRSSHPLQPGAKTELVVQSALRPATRRTRCRLSPYVSDSSLGVDGGAVSASETPDRSTLSPLLSVTSAAATISPSALLRRISIMYSSM